MTRNNSLYPFILGALFFVNLSYADVPVVDGNGGENPPFAANAIDDSTTAGAPDNSTQVVLPDEQPNNNTTIKAAVPLHNETHLSPSQRLSKLEEQVTNINQNDYQNQIQNLKQEVQTLQGKLEEQQHIIDKLQQQQVSMYKDLANQVSPKSSLSGASKSEPEQEASSTNIKPDLTSDKKKVSTEHMDAKPNISNKEKENSSAKTTLASNQTNKNDKPAGTDEQAVYQRALALIKSGDYGKATGVLKKYTKTYPQGEYAANCHYWLGEIYYVQNSSKNAIAEFNTVITKFPKDPKVADSKLKLGFIYFDNGDVAQAKRYLQEVIKNYAGTSAAQLAKSRLNQISTLS